MGLKSVGAVATAPLDINWSYPKPMVFPSDAQGVRFGQSVFAGFANQEDQLIRKPSPRDFFYVVRK